MRLAGLCGLDLELLLGGEERFVVGDFLERVEALVVEEVVFTSGVVELEDVAFGQGLEEGLVDGAGVEGAALVGQGWSGARVVEEDLLLLDEGRDLREECVYLFGEIGHDEELGEAQSAFPDVVLVDRDEQGLVDVYLLLEDVLLEG